VSEYNDIELQDNDIDWSVCDPSLDFHTNQPDGENQNCVAFHYYDRYVGSPTECTWGVYDYGCENTAWVNKKLTVCTADYDYSLLKE
jgi:hypothetical protein